MHQKSGTITDKDGNTHSVINLDWVTFDKTTGQMILHEKGTGADACIPFSGRKGVTVCATNSGSNTIFVANKYIKYNPRSATALYIVGYESDFVTRTTLNYQVNASEVGTDQVLDLTQYPGTAGFCWWSYSPNIIDNFLFE